MYRIVCYKRSGNNVLVVILIYVQRDRDRNHFAITHNCGRMLHLKCIAQ